MSDWKVRHRKMCKSASKQREQLASVGKMMQSLSDVSLTGGGGGGGGDFSQLLAGLMSGQQMPPETAAAVSARRADLKAEKKRGKE